MKPIDGVVWAISLGVGISAAPAAPTTVSIDPANTPIFNTSIQTSPIEEIYAAAGSLFRDPISKPSAAARTGYHKATTAGVAEIGKSLEGRVVTPSKNKENHAELVPIQDIEGSIVTIRGRKVILDADLANLYETETRVLVQAVKRNLDRFPEDFMFQLDKEEFELLRSQSVTSRRWGGRRYPPYAFTEQGVAMLSGVLRTPRAVQANIQIMRAFVRLRGILAEHEDLKRRLAALEGHYDKQFKQIFSAIRQLMAPPSNTDRKLIGFEPAKKKKK